MSNTALYPKLEENQLCLDHKELFINRLPHPLAKSYFCMLNHSGQRRFSYFLELIELTLGFYYAIFAAAKDLDLPEGKLSLGQLLFSLQNILNCKENSPKLNILKQGFKQNCSCFRKLIKLRNRTWGHSKVRTETDYDHYYLLNLSLLNQVLEPLLNFGQDYFVIEGIISFRKKMVLIKAFKFLGFSPFGKREIISLAYEFDQLKRNQVFLKNDELILDLSKWQRFDYCEVCHLDSFFIFQDSFKRKESLISVFDCVNCGSRKVINFKEKLDK